MKSTITQKYEVVLGIPDKFEGDIFDSNLSPVSMVDVVNEKWKEFAKEFYDETGVYVSAIAVPGKALYNDEWGCPNYGEPVITFHCTANPEFIKSMYKYEEGILYISKKLKKAFEQHTVSVTKLLAGMFYITDENEEEINTIL